MEMTFAHTPAPWMVRATPESSNQEFIVHHGKWAVAGVDYGENAQADARLIAAAPSLFNALHDIADIRNNNQRFGGACDDAALLRAVIERAGHAIAGLLEPVGA